jgi:regulation of enolase protein 1 (concanavalin A-like superfamily)
MKKTILFIFLLFIIGNDGWSQSTFPLEVKNTTPYPDNQVYIAIVGNGKWIDLKTGNVNIIKESYNTIGIAGTTELYANCFTKLSEIPNRTFNLKEISSARMFLSVQKQLYLHFFDSGGYSAPNPDNSSDPNVNTLYEFMEFNYQNGFIFANTSRVDSYNYAMGLEVYGPNNFYKKVGELKSHTAIGTSFLNTVPTEFKGCYDATAGRIRFPTNIAAFKTGGAYENYMKPYIDAIWTKYKTEDLYFDAGQAGIWKGRVDANDRLTLVNQQFPARIGIVSRRPTTSEAFNGSGVLAQTNGIDVYDRLVQAQLVAAITRHVINTTTTNVGLQTWSDPTKYYLVSPCNYYAKFWHQKDISVDGLSYGFAYDDVFDQSSTIAVSPTKMIITFGGFAGTTTTSLPSPWKNQDVGTVAVPGSASFSSSTFTLKGAGDDIYGTADGFQFAYQTLTGDGEIIAKVTGLDNTHVYAKAGIMIRESLTSDSKHALTNLTPTGKVEFLSRSSTSSSTSNAEVVQTIPQWIRLKRVGNVFTSSYSSDGITWINTSASRTIAMSATLYVGLAACSHTSGLTTATFTNVSIKSTATGNVNLARGKSTSASSIETAGLAANFATDADETGTRWASSRTGISNEYIQVDLGASYDISRVVLKWETAYASSYSVLISNNATFLGSVANVSITGGNGSTDDLTLTGANKTGRYVRIYCTQRGTIYDYSLFDFQVYGTLSTLRETTETVSLNPLNIFPNPVEDKLNIDFATDSFYKKVVVYDVNGKLVLDQNLTGNATVHTIDTSKLANGLYVLEISTREQTYIRKFVKH